MRARLSCVLAIAASIPASQAAAQSTGAIGAFDGTDVRTNVSTVQAGLEPGRVYLFNYVRLGYGAEFGTGGLQRPALGFGWRIEHDAFALDFSLVSMLLPTTVGGDQPSGAGSALRLEGLHFTRSTLTASGYFGAGLSFGWTSGPSPSSADSISS